MTAREKIQAILEPIGDVEMILLKGHLLLEEKLFAAVRAQLTYPEEHDKMRLSFYKNLQLLSCFMQISEPLDFETLADLNRLRNKLAHNVSFEAWKGELKAWACGVMAEEVSSIVSEDAFRDILVLALSVQIEFFDGFSDMPKLA